MARILVIDDDPQVRKYIGQVLIEEGHEVHLAANGKEGLKTQATVKAEIVVLDLIMPEKEGLETTTDLLSMTPDVRIIAISGGGRLTPDTFLHVARRLGARHSLRKPFGREDLLQAVDALTPTADGPE